MHTAVEKLIRPHYRTLQGYVSAGMESDKSAQKIFLNANENPYTLPGLDGFNRYPEPQPKALRDAYSALYGAPADNIIMTRGADEAIAVLTKLFCEPEKDAILICPPTFGMYKVNATTMPSNTISVPLLKQGGSFALDVAGISARIDDAKLIFICSPNNPTGTSFAADDILNIIQQSEGRAMVVLDETYIEMAEADSFASILCNHPNLIILRTLSKSYAMAGMRMGSMLCGDADLAALIRAKGLDAYPLPVASIDAALHVTSPDILPIARANIATLIAARKTMEEALKQSDEVTHVHPSDANFLLVEIKRPDDFLKACAAQNIIIRDFSSKPDTPNCIRLSIGTEEQNQAVLNILRTF